MLKINSQKFWQFRKKCLSLQADMLCKQECIKRILANADVIMNDYGVRSLRLFGSLARNEQHESSDVDVFVDMPPHIYQIIGLKDFLEELLDCRVDLIRKHQNNNAFLLEQIEKDGVDIISQSSPCVAYA
jgi:predicted nucleotidyltransferase